MSKQLQRFFRLFCSLSLVVILVFSYVEPVSAQPLLQTPQSQEEIVQFLFGLAKQTFVSIYQSELHYEANEHPSEHLGRQVGHAIGRTIAKFLDPFGSDQ
jgi:hypothetical protein